MRERGLDISGRRPKHLRRFARRRFDYVISLCDRVREVCPELPGRPETIHWSIPDPAAATGSGDETYPRFAQTAAELETRIRFLLHRITSSHKPGGDVNVNEDTVNVRYMVGDVGAAIDFYTGHFGFTVQSDHAPAFADVTRGNLRLLLSGPTSSAGRPMPDGRRPGPGGWNRIHLIVDDITAEVDRLRAAGISFRNEIVTGPGGRQIQSEDPDGNPIELFEPAP
jgi:catechol 2,3-dioxygenase-like lactoylglutathione lyase family enzyme